MKSFLRLALFALLMLVVSSGCKGRGGGESNSFGSSMTLRLDQMTPDEETRHFLYKDRSSILGMAGTFKVEFAFEESLPVRKGYELHKPYQTDAEEVVVVVEDRPDFISLQHLLVVRHEGAAHVIKHWRQDWQYQGEQNFQYQGDEAWKIRAVGEEDRRGAWVQTVYNADDSPRYSAVGRWDYDGEGVSLWQSEPAPRPVPLREKHLSDEYTMLVSKHTLVVSMTRTGWQHLQNQ